ncbi:MAG: phosphatase PAP2 family protein [Patescibacteria group bacterium]|nr:phosphatase PAP2 family protein [Patescibacteria group bacterium]
MPEQATLTADTAASRRSSIPPDPSAIRDVRASTVSSRAITCSMPLVRWDRRLFDAGQTVPLVAPCMLVLLATLFFRMTEADLLITGLFHDQAACRFPLAQHPLFLAIYDWGPVPAWLLGIGSLVVLAAAAMRQVPQTRARGALFLLAFLVLGPIVLVNVAYKGYWGRPRPDQTTHFGGCQAFLHVLEKGPTEQYQSFPSGHAAAGFCLLAPAFLLYRRHPRAAGACMAFGLLAGLIVGLGRVVQGRHFASDIVWAAAVVYFTCCALDYLILARAPTLSGRSTGPSADNASSNGERHRPVAMPDVQTATPRRKAA